MFLLDSHTGEVPKRGDLFQTNIGNPRERTWLILRVRRIRRRNPDLPRYEVWAARWWELEVDQRMSLFRSAERRGGQRLITFWRYPAKKKQRKNVFTY